MAAAKRQTRQSALERRYGPKAAKPVVLIFPRAEWAVEEARIWAALHGLDPSEFNITANYVRVGNGSRTAKRQKTIRYGIGGVRAVVEWR